MIAAAEEVFAEHGFVRARIEHIAASAGFTKGAVYSSFAHKDDLFFALLDRRVTHRGMLAQRAGSIGEAADGLVDTLRSDPAWTVLLLEFWADAARDPQRRARLEEHRAPLRAEIAAVLAGLQPDLPLEPEAMATVVIALVNGLAVEEIARPGQEAGALLGRALPLLLRAAS